MPPHLPCPRILILSEPQKEEMEKARVWDLPTRLFHWALVGTVCTGWYLGENRNFSTIQLHFYFGYAVGGLLVFRLIWGMIGPSNVRLSALFPSPRKLRAYLSGIKDRKPGGARGHNPMGALSVLAMLIVLILQVVTGLFSEDDSLFAEGPLAQYVSTEMMQQMTSLHHLTSKLVMLLVVLHLAAILFYFVWKRENLVKPMITGWKKVRRKAEDD